MTQKTPTELLNEIVLAYEALVNAELTNQPSLVEAARGGLSDRIQEAREMKGAPPVPEHLVHNLPNAKRRGW